MVDVLDVKLNKLATGAGEVLRVFGAIMIVKADPAELGIFLGEHAIPPGYVVPPHIHADEDEIFYGLEGELTLMDPDGERTLLPGETAQLPAGSRHGFRNDTTDQVRFLVIARPGLQAVEMFRHFDRAGCADPEELTPQEIVAICGQDGVRMG
ncbi:MAG TPA: cupin domain-containing protein [Geminicoccus sp.]|jgi:quercetin dioxygenase-like cupin family protein|uniref:cupin domain-containing protein n=1 Tax=Geminicoccus sp. TaxID=2024832 RepID=UPI002E3748A8|nr:cupin domain-containing protein [Geminicoccus sp.]HEX2526888.1 cupin domain-containing protein [Geminicoccus sp.]